MNNYLWIFIDDRGLSRPILEFWVPALSIDVIWTTGKTLDAEIDLNAEGSPALELSPADIAALSSEFTDEQGHVLVVIDSLAALQDAIDFGLEVPEVTIVHHVKTNGERVGPSASFTREDIRQVEHMARRGLKFFIQPIPNVTARPWKGSRAHTRPEYMPVS